MHNRLSLLAWLLFGPLFLGTAAGAPPAAPAPKPKPKEIPLVDRLRLPQDPARPLTDKLRSPRETLKTLYFAVNLYDLFPQMMDDAVACLDLDGLQPRPTTTDAIMLALDLEYILQSLALPLCSVPDRGAGECVVLHEADGIKLTLCPGPDGCWRFDRETVQRIPALRRAVRERHPRSADLAAFREGFTDPRTAMRQFISDVAHGDFYSAARALDLSLLNGPQRRHQGPALAQQLACILQRRGYFFRQEVPYQPDGPLYTWHADQDGRIALNRVRQPDGKEAWLFTRQTVRNIPRMYAAIQASEPNWRYVRMGFVVPLLQAPGSPAVQKRPEEVPAHLGSPRALLQGFFRIMDAPDARDDRLAEALEYLNLDNVPAADRASLGIKLAVKLQAVLRKLTIDLSAIPDDWNAPPQVLGEAQGVRIEIVRQRDGWWCFSDSTVTRIPEMFDKLAGKARPDQGRGSQLDSARDTVITFQSAARRGDFDLAARCLNLNEVQASAREEVGPILAFKLHYVLAHIGRIYVEEISDNPEGPRHVLYRGELGRIVLDRRAEDPGKGLWQFIPETVEQVEPMFRAVLDRPAESEDAEPVALPPLGGVPAAWVRLQLPGWLQVGVGPFDLYQWLGLILAALASWLGARVTMAGITRCVAWLLRRSGSDLSGGFVAATLRPLTWLAAAWVLFLLVQVLDLRVAVAGPLFAAKKFLLAALIGWLGVRLMDLSMAVYTNSEMLRPHRSLSDMIVPVSVRLGKTVVLLAVAVYIIYQVGEVDLLGRFLTGLGVAGLAASLAAQDAMKSYFGTLLLIGERAFKIGDRILVSGKEGVVEQVGFRSTRLRTAEDSLLTVPNSVIAAAPIENMGARLHHRFQSRVVVSPDTPFDKLLELRERLQGWVEQQTLVVREKVDVHVHEVGPEGIEVSLSLFLHPVAPAAENRFREALTCEILGLVGALGVAVSPSYRCSLVDTAGGAAVAAPPKAA